LFRVLFVMLCVVVMIIGVQLLSGATARARETGLYQARLADYAGTATGIVQSQATDVPPTTTPTPQVNAPKPGGYVLARQNFETNTPLPPLDLATNTPPPTESATPTPTSIPATVTPDAIATSRPLPTPFFYGEAPADAVAPTAIPAPVELIDRRGYDLMNILLMGNDGEISDDGFIRTDTMIVVSINRTTGTVSMLSLPRDLFVYIPGWTMQRLNLAYIHGEAVGWTDGGFGLLRQTIFYNLGINVHYYAMVSLEGFRAVVDAVGGVNISVDCAIQNLPLIGADVPRDAIRVNDDGEYALPVGYYEMTGGEALWYARARDTNSDFDRGARQQQILRAVWRRARDNGLLNSVPQLWNETTPYLDTNLTLEDLLPLVPLAGSLDTSRIESFTFARLYHTTPWTPPDGSNVQLPNPEQVRELMIDFYSPPTESQIASEAATVRVYNGTTIPNLDIVAADRLNWEGIAAIPMGQADSSNHSTTSVIDFTGRSKGSSLGQIVATLNIAPAGIQPQPDAAREADFEVILGASYNSCTRGGILPIETPTAGS
jgi:LCP family protein required for cell wall assembly